MENLNVKEIKDEDDEEDEEINEENEDNIGKIDKGENQNNYKKNQQKNYDNYLKEFLSHPNSRNDSANLYSSQKVNEKNGNTNYITTNNNAGKQNTGTNNESGANEKRTGTYTASNGKTYSTVGSISIPSIDVNYPILSETSDSLLKVSVCKFWGCDPNEVGNLCIVGHNYKNNQFFSRLSELNVGDKVFLTPNNGKDLKYLVYNKYEIEETDMECTNQNTNVNVEITLITCTKDKKKRLVVKCKAVI